MITGSVNSYREPMIRLALQGANNQDREVEVIVDAGFSGSFTLPTNTIAALGLPFRSRGSATLADGSEIQFDIYAAVVLWDGTPRSILVEAADTDPLLGMSLLYGHRINVEAVDGGSVTIEKLMP